MKRNTFSFVLLLFLTFFHSPASCTEDHIDFDPETGRSFQGFSIDNDDFPLLRHEGKKLVRLKPPGENAEEEIAWVGKDFSPTGPDSVGRYVDERKKIISPSLKVFPYKSILSIEIKFEGSDILYLGTATMIHYDIALTTAHLLYKQGKRAEKITCYGCRCGESYFGGACKVLSYAYPKEFKESPSRGSPFNYGVLRLSEKMGDELGFIFPKPYEDVLSSKVFISGYPGFTYDEEGKVNTDKGIFQYKHQGKVHETKEKTHLLFHQVHATEGQAGAPVTVKIGDKREDWRIIAIQTKGTLPLRAQEGSEIKTKPFKNEALKIDKKTFLTLKEFRYFLAQPHKIERKEIQEKNFGEKGCAFFLPAL